jgi:hypothetical protein
MNIGEIQEMKNTIIPTAVIEHVMGRCLPGLTLNDDSKTVIEHCLKAPIGPHLEYSKQDGVQEFSIISDGEKTVFKMISSVCDITIHVTGFTEETGTKGNSNVSYVSYKAKVHWVYDYLFHTLFRGYTERFSA